MRRELLNPADHPAAVRNGANGDRRPDGRFGRGNKAAVGRRPAAHEWKEAAREAVTPEMLRAIFAAAAARALRGNLVAARFVAEYVIGKPAQRVDLFTTDRDAEYGDGWDYRLSANPAWEQYA